MGGAGHIAQPEEATPAGTDMDNVKEHRVIETYNSAKEQVHSFR